MLNRHDVSRKKSGWRRFIQYRLRTLLFALFIATASSFLISNVASADESWRNDPPIKKILAWLPLETETVIVDRRAATLTRNKTAGRFFDVADPEVPSGAEWSLVKIGGGVYFDQLAGRKTLLLLEANNGYVLPPGPAGAGRYQGCQFFVFGAGDADAVKAVFDNMLQNADRKETLHDCDVACFDQEGANYLVAAPQSGVLLIATDRNFLTRVLGNLSTPHQSVLDDPLWEHVEDPATVWAIRHGKQSLLFDPGMTGMLYQYIPNEEKTVTIRHTTTFAITAREIRGNWTFPDPWNGKPRVRHAKQGVFEIEHTLRDQSFIVGFSIILAHHLGCEMVF